MAATEHDVREEYWENEPTGVEVEPEDDAGIDRPWDPRSIRVNTKQFSLRNILDLIQEDDLELAPDFQRHRVWKPGQKSRLIESVLLQIPLPAFYFAEDEKGMMRVVDGLQRLSTVRDFVRGAPPFVLQDLEYLKDQEGRTFEDLPQALRRRIHNTQIVAHVIDPTTPTDVMYDIFKRINTGGSPLNGQEIRHCMSKDRSRNFLKECTETQEFRLATGARFPGHVRMHDRESVLRFCAFHLLGVEKYKEQRSMDSFLEETTRHLDDPERISDQELGDLRETFRRSMTNCFEVFGGHAFRKWPLGTDDRKPINRPLFECWSVALADLAPEDVRARRTAVASRARTLMTSDQEYIDAITSSTGIVRRVELRFSRTRGAARAGS